MLEYASNIDETYTPDSPEAQELLGTVLFALNPNGTFDEFYQNLGETVPEEYDILSLVSCIQSGEIETYLNGDERNAYRAIRSSSAASVFLSGNMTDDENVEKIVAELSSYGVTKEKYDRFGYTYDSIKYMSQNTILTYRSRIDYETEILDERLSAGEITEETYPIEWQKANQNLIGDITDSLLRTGRQRLDGLRSLDVHEEKNGRLHARRLSDRFALRDVRLDDRDPDAFAYPSSARTSD